MASKEGGVIEKETLPFVMTHLPDNVKKKAEVELNESPEKMVNGVRELKALAREHKLACDINFEDDFLVTYLRKAKYDIPKAFKQLLTMIKLRKSGSYRFQSIDLDKYFCYPSVKFFSILPRRCPDGCTIILYDIGKWIPEELPVDEWRTFGTAMFCQSMRYPISQINGYKIIFDCYNVPLKSIRHFTPRNIYLFYHGALDCFPGRYKSLVMVVNSAAMKYVWTIFQGFAPKKLRDRMFVKSSPKDVIEHFPPSVLPVKYGGELTDYYMTEWMELANEQQDKNGIGGQKNFC